MRYDIWQAVNEAFAPVTLGLGRPTKLGGPIGSRFQEAGFVDDEDEEDEEDDENDGNEEDDENDGNLKSKDDEEDGLEGDLFGSSEDDGVEKSFPPDDGQEMDGLPTPDAAMLGGDKDAPGGDMDFLNDIDPELAGMGEQPDDMGGVPGEAGSEEMGTPCPDCNPEGTEMEGDPQCPSCMGIGFMPDDLGDDAGDMGDEDLDVGDDFMAPKPDKMPKFMGVEPGRQGCCEHDDFMKSLASNMTDMRRRYSSSGVKTEDALFHNDDQNASFDSEPTAGHPGFAPQQRIGSMGGGYTRDDIKSIPVLGESFRVPTLAQYMAAKERLKNRK